MGNLLDKVKKEYARKLRQRNKVAVALQMSEIHLTELEQKIEDGVEGETVEESTEEMEKLLDYTETIRMTRDSRKRKLERLDQGIDFLLKKTPKYVLTKNKGGNPPQRSDDLQRDSPEVSKDASD